MPEQKNGKRVLIAGMCLMLVLGSVHAFSVFLEPMEQFFQTSRDKVSFTYSLALVALTATVFFGHRIYGMAKPPVLIAFVCLLAMAGCLIAASATTIAMVWLGYGILFGAANGIGYGFALQSSAQANPESKGIAMGLITACYALGAIISPVFFQMLVDSGGFPAAMTGLAIALAVIAAPLSLMFIGTHFEFSKQINQPDRATQHGRLMRLWIGYGMAVLAGLMTIGHAAGIARSAGLNDGMVLAAPIAIAALNMVGSLLGGWYADRGTITNSLSTFPALSAVVLIALATVSGTGITLSCLALVGFCYGAIIAIYPVVIGRLFGPAAGVRAYGMVFTAWGTAGLIGPLLAGILFEWSGNYTPALLLAALCSLLSIASIRTLRTGNSI